MFCSINIMGLEMLIDSANIVFSYIPTDWSNERFQKSGGFVAVVLNYNKAGLINKAARSALIQDYKCYEILFLDDCSTDGSEQELIDIAKEYAANGGRCKVTVVVNKKNRSILGQWKLAASLSEFGKWFIMFCGDDVSHPTRISKLSSLAQSNPTAWGICTYFATESNAGFSDAKGVLKWNGAMIERPWHNFFGCTAMWRREVFDPNLPYYNLDDFFLFWSVIIRRQDDNDTALVWDFNSVEVDYSVGSGITTDVWKGKRSTSFVEKVFMLYQIKMSQIDRYGANLWSKISDFDVDNGHAGRIRQQIKGYNLLIEYSRMNWLQRLWGLILMYFKVVNYGGMENFFKKSIRRIFLERILGKYSFLLCHIISNIKRRLISLK